MRLLTLNLERYGPFTGRTLTFKPEAKLHLVYGPNEAGKSCALAAVTDLFFGIDRQTPFDFLHEGKDLRIGATIMGRDDGFLTFRRRKGNKNTLIDASDSALNGDALLPYLGGLTREIFCNAFGLDSEALRRGAQEMLRSDGDVGASLFAAASGMRGLADLRRCLEEEAATIFASRASKDRKFYRAFGRFEEARKAIHDRELRAGDWNALNEKIERLSRRLNEIKTLRGLNAAAHARLSRNKRLAPLVALIDRDLARLVELGEMPEVPLGFTQSLGERLEALRQTTETSKRIANDNIKAIRDNAEIKVDERLLARADNIQRLLGETGAYANNRRDLPRIQAEADEYSALLAELAVRLGLSAACAVEAAQPTDAAQALVRGLISEGRNLTDTLSRNGAALASERAAHRELGHQRAQHGGLIDPQPWREKFVTLAPVLRILEKRAETEQAIRTEARSVRELAGRLDPPVNDLDLLAGTSLPSFETITRFRRDLDVLARELRRERDRLVAATEGIAATKSTLRELTLGRPLPSKDAIAAKRRERDRDWGALRATLFGCSEAVAGSRLVEVTANFERHSSEADQLADSAATDAERVAAHAVQTRRLMEGESKEAEAKDRIAVLEDTEHLMLKAWAAAWAPTGITPPQPSEMAGWRSAIEGLLDRREKLERLRDGCAAMDATVANSEPAFRALAAEIALQELEGAGIALLARQIEDRLGSISESWEKARDLDTRMRDVEHRIENLSTMETQAKRDLEEWSARWRLALRPIAMPATSTLDEVEAALGVWTKVPNTIRERNNRARRVAGMQRNLENFERQAKELLADFSPDLARLAADAAVKMLNDRLVAARAADARRRESRRRLAEVMRAGEDANAAAAEAEGELAALAAKLPTDTDLTDLLRRLTERDSLRDVLQERRTQLIAQAEGSDEDKLRDDLADFNAEDVESALTVLIEEGHSLEREAQEVFAAHAQAVRERAAAEQSMGAEVAAQQRSSAEAELMAASREWAVLKLGALLVGTAIDRRRETQHDPLMARAGDLFAMLTGRSFVGVGQAYDERDTPHLVGLRPTGGTVPISGMSTGTRDQLYLALRLAYIEEYAIRAEPAPFIGDDLFATFDDDRTANGFSALAAIGNRVQPIVFTHHRQIAEIAQNNVGADVLVL